MNFCDCFLDCGRKCWCLSSNGLQGVGQRELAFIIERLPEENSLPKDIFSLYLNIYQDAQKGTLLVALVRLCWFYTFCTFSELYLWPFFFFLTTGKYIEELGNVTFADSFLGSKEHGGFLFLASSFQPLEDLGLPHSSFLFGVLIHKLEVPWAKVFPLRLVLSMGAECSGESHIFPRVFKKFFLIWPTSWIPSANSWTLHYVVCHLWKWFAVTVNCI